MNYMKCDRCGWITPIENVIVKEQMEGQTKIQFLQCGKCGEKFIASVMTPEIQRGISDIQSRRQEIRIMQKKKFKEKSIRKKIMEYEAFRVELKQKMDEAKKIYLGEESDGQEEAKTAHSMGVFHGNSIEKSEEDSGTGRGAAETVPGYDSTENPVPEEMVTDGGNLSLL